MEIKIKKGDEIYCVHRMAMMGGKEQHTPIKGKVIVITQRLNRQIGVELEEEIQNGHDCDGRGKAGRCLWCRPWHILTLDEWEKVKKSREIAAKNAKQLDAELDELVLRSVG